MGGLRQFVEEFVAPFPKERSASAYVTGSQSAGTLHAIGRKPNQNLPITRTSSSILTVFIARVEKPMHVSESSIWWRNSNSCWVKEHHHRKGSEGGDNATKLLIQAAELKRGMRILDIASGAGDPAITLAENVDPTSHVIAIDLISKRVVEAKINARVKGLINLSLTQADGQILPFRHRSFDVVTCRFGVIYFPDAEQAAQEILRVLKPGGKVLLLVWGAEEHQERVRCVQQVLKKYRKKHEEVTRTNPSKPGLYRYATPEPLLAILGGVGFEQVKADYHLIPEVWVGTLEEYLKGGGLVSVEDQIKNKPPKQQRQIHEDLLKSMRKHFGGEVVNFKQSMILISAER